MPAVLLASAVAAASRAPCRDAHLLTNPVREARAVRCLINRERARHGLAAVRREAHLERAAIA